MVQVCLDALNNILKHTPLSHREAVTTEIEEGGGRIHTREGMNERIDSIYVGIRLKIFKHMQIERFISNLMKSSSIISPMIMLVFLLL